MASFIHLSPTTHSLIRILNKGDAFYIKHGNQSLALSPIDHLEISIAGCIASCILDYIIENKLDYVPFSNTAIYISNKSIRIVAQCSDDMQNVFKNLIDNCYICSIITLPRHIEFNL